MEGAGEERSSGVCVFLAEDDDAMRTLLAELLRRDGHRVVEASNGETMLFNLAQRGVERSNFAYTSAVVICDIRMPICDGLSLLRNLREHGGACPPFVFTTAFPEASAVREAYELGALRVFEKPFDLGELRHFIRERALVARAD